MTGRSWWRRRATTFTIRSRSSAGLPDGFENWLGANVAYYKHQTLPAANLYWAAARSGKYPKAYKYAADLFYVGGRVDMVEKVAAGYRESAGESRRAMGRVHALQDPAPAMGARRDAQRGARGQMGRRRAELSQELSARPLRVRTALSPGRAVPASGGSTSKRRRSTSRSTAIPTTISPRASTPPNVTIARWRRPAESRSTMASLTPAADLSSDADTQTNNGGSRGAAPEDDRGAERGDQSRAERRDARRRPRSTRRSTTAADARSSCWRRCSNISRRSTIARSRRFSTATNRSIRR